MLINILGVAAVVCMALMTVTLLIVLRKFDLI